LILSIRAHEGGVRASTGASTVFGAESETNRNNVENHKSVSKRVGPTYPNFSHDLKGAGPFYERSANRVKNVPFSVAARRFQ